MAYKKQYFKNGNVLTAEQLNHMEDGIVEAEKSGGSGGTGGASFAQTYTDMTPGYVSAKNGTFGTGGNWQRTDYIPVSSGDVVTFSGRIGDSMGVAGYDENKAFVASVLDRINLEGGYTYENEPLTIPDGVAYIAGCTISGAYPITVMVYKDAKALVEAGGTGLPSDVGPYKQMATDGEGKWVPVDRLGYKTVSETEFIPSEERTGEWLEVIGCYNTQILDVTSPLVAGKKYVIYFDGVRYEQVATETTSGDITSVVLGSTILEDSSGYVWDYPFNIGTPLNLGFNACSVNTQKEVFTIGVYELSETIHPIPAEYLTNAPQAGCVYVKIYYDDEAGANVANKTFDEITNAIVNGRVVCCVYNDTTLLPLTGSTALNGVSTFAIVPVSSTHTFSSVGLGNNGTTASVTRITIDSDNVVDIKIGTFGVTPA